MAQVLIRDLDKATVDALKQRARREGRSLQAALKAILEETAAAERFDAESELARLRALFEGRCFADSAALVREDRGR